MKVFGRCCLLLCAGLLLLLLVLLIQVQVVSYSVSFYQSEFAKLRQPDALGTSLDQLLRFSAHTTRYLRGLEQDPNLSMVLYGEERLLLNEREVSHMQDVQALFRTARLVTAVGLSLLAALALIACLGRRLRPFLRSLALAAICALLIGTLGGVAISRDFTAAFDRFHLLAFTNDLWQLDPAEDQLINLLPEQFFADAVLSASVRTVATLVALILLPPLVNFLSVRPKLL